MARDAITHHRKLKGLSQGALGALINIDAHNISRIERGYRDISPSEASAISNVLAVSLVDLGLAKPAPVHPTAPSTKPAMAKIPENDLAYPANFKLMPDETLLTNSERGDLASIESLKDALKLSEKILHTSKVPAATWRAWRDFQRRGADILRSK